MREWRKRTDEKHECARIGASRQIGGRQVTDCRHVARALSITLPTLLLLRPRPQTQAMVQRELRDDRLCARHDLGLDRHS